MSKKSKVPTFAELLEQPTWSEGPGAASRVTAVRPGRYNQAGELFDPDGRLLALQHERVGPELAQELVQGGALVAHESCGCGGWTGCPPDWLSEEALARLRSADAPALVDNHGVPTWIEVWSSEGGQVVYLHGDIRWGDEFR